jgi:signal transduction histidine kinase
MTAARSRWGWGRALALVLGTQLLFWGGYALLIGQERFRHFDLVWLAIAVQGILGAALLVLLPISRFSRLQTITGLFMLSVSADAWLTAFGAAELPYAWFPLLRYGVEYLMLAAVALTVNAFAGWRPREARIAGLCFVAAFAVVIAATLTGDIAAVVPWLDAAAIVLLFVYGLAALLRMSRSAPGPAIRVLAILLVGLASIAWDLLLRPASHGALLQASVLTPTLTAFAVLFELALQGRRLNQEADEARTDLERQMLEQDASLLRSSSLLRHQERQIAVNAERQRLVRDMHDGMGGLLTHLLLNVQEGRLTGAQIAQGLQSALDELRNMMGAIDAGHEPLDEALAAFHERMAARLAGSGMVFDWRCDVPAPAPSLDTRRLLGLYRLLQEGVANVLRHARASRIELAVEAVGDDVIVVTLSDDGVGFAAANPGSAPGEGRGLANMRRRARQMDAQLRIDSTPGAGTRLVLRVGVEAG